MDIQPSPTYHHACMVTQTRTQMKDRTAESAQIRVSTESRARDEYRRGQERDSAACPSDYTAWMMTTNIDRRVTQHRFTPNLHLFTPILHLKTTIRREDFTDLRVFSTQGGTDASASARSHTYPSPRKRCKSVKRPPPSCD